MSTDLQSSLDGLENFVNQATTTLAQTRKGRWKKAFVAIYCSRAFCSPFKEAISTNATPVRSNPHPTIDQSNLTNQENLNQFDGVKGLTTVLKANLRSEINGYEEDIANPCEDVNQFDGVKDLKTAAEANLESEINGYEEDIANPSEDLSVESLTTTVKTNLQREINGSEEDTANPSEDSITKTCRPTEVPRSYSTKVLSMGKELCKKFSRARSYTVVDVEPDRFSRIDRPSLCNLVNQKNAILLFQFGGVEGVITKLESNAENGIHGHGEDIASRHKSFGSNSYRKPPAKNFHILMQVVIEAFKDPMILLLLVCASLSVGFGTAKHGLSGLTNGGSIFAAIFLVILVFASSNFRPESGTEVHLFLFFSLQLFRFVAFSPSLSINRAFVSLVRKAETGGGLQKEKRREREREKNGGKAFCVPIAWTIEKRSGRRNKMKKSCTRIGDGIAYLGVSLFWFSLLFYFFQPSKQKNS